MPDSDPLEMFKIDTDTGKAMHLCSAAGADDAISGEAASTEPFDVISDSGVEGGVDEPNEGTEPMEQPGGSPGF